MGKKSFWFSMAACVAGVIFILCSKSMANNPMMLGLAIGALGLFLCNLAAAWGYRHENE